jgi:hypothetical protein
MAATSARSISNSLDLAISASIVLAKLDFANSRLYSLELIRRLAVFSVFCVAFLARGYAAEPIASRTADVEGVKLHYLSAGHGPPILLLHGYAETSLMWKPVIPLLAERATVIAPDLPGIGESSISADGLDMKSAAVRIHVLVRSLGSQKVEVVGHDIGLMVAYAYAAMYRKRPQSSS